MANNIQTLLGLPQLKTNEITEDRRRRYGVSRYHFYEHEKGNRAARAHAEATVRDALRKALAEVGLETNGITAWRGEAKKVNVDARADLREDMTFQVRIRRWDCRYRTVHKTIRERLASGLDFERAAAVTLEFLEDEERRANQERTTRENVGAARASIDRLDVPLPLGYHILKPRGDGLIDLTLKRLTPEQAQLLVNRAAEVMK